MMRFIHRHEPESEPGDVIEMMLRSNADPSEMDQPNPSTEEAHWELREDTRRRPIISINGEDIEEGELDRAA
jgi:hypothetical protein